jgi:hypothetical protein
VAPGCVAFSRSLSCLRVTVRTELGSWLRFVPSVEGWCSSGCQHCWISECCLNLWFLKWNRGVSRFPSKKNYIIICPQFCHLGIKDLKS